ncbi:MAG TPA: glycosyltransferase family 39 protein [candidate division Zixibacteria bacterium]|nr:glycosyltransferase family 39 protein [candidate division Zixibacteria bacterium]
MTTSNRFRNLIPVLSTILLGSALRIINIGHQSLWLDEFFSYFLARKDLAAIIEGTTQDVLPPLYYFFLHYTLNFGSDETAVRAVSLIFSVLTLPVVYILAKSLFSRRVALASTFLLAISPLHVLFAQEARMYTMFAFFSAVALLFFWRSWQDNRLVDWLLFALSITATLYSHSLAIFNLLAIDAFCLIQFRVLRERLRGLLLAHIISIMLFLPWIVTMVGQIPRLQSEFAGASQSIFTLITTPYLFLFGVSLKPALVPLALFAGLALVAFTILSLWYAIRERKPESESLILALCILVVPVLGVYLMSFIQPVFVLRRLLPASLGLIFLVSWTVMEAKPRWLNLAAGFSVALLMLAALFNYYLDPDVQKVRLREVVQVLSEKTSEGDIFIHATDTSALAFAYYAPELKSHFLAGDPDYIAETNRGRAQRIAGLEPETLNSIIGLGDIFWLVVVMDHNLEYQTDLVERFDQEFVKLSQENIHGVDVLRYSREMGSETN